jgi:hypothetical protein
MACGGEDENWRFRAASLVGAVLLVAFDIAELTNGLILAAIAYSTTVLDV